MSDWRYREFRCKHGFVQGENCPDCKVKAKPKRREAVWKHSKHWVPAGYGKEELNARRNCL